MQKCIEKGTHSQQRQIS
uniref:Uncharacterized protein n=1 Tax=Oscillatoriales cyanobacterium SpSt-418 TaxID=2282169 RepID=A0A7C3PEI0_9CYAN